MGNPQVLYVYSGKGGVGKSTVTVNLAYAFSTQGIRTSLFDADLHGPSVPTMVSALETTPPRMSGIVVSPGTYGGVAINSAGFVSRPDEGSYCAGKYLEGALYQLAIGVKWPSELLIIDLPPGSTDIHRILFSKMPGKAVLVTTPQEVSYADTIRGADMLRRLQIDVIGVVENMSYYQCGVCAEKRRIFSGDTKHRLCEPHGLTLLAELPLEPAVSDSTNSGAPYVVAAPDAPISLLYKELAQVIQDEYPKVHQLRPVC